MNEPSIHVPRVQFVLELPTEWKAFITGHHTPVSIALNAALCSVFGVPDGTPCRLTLDFTDQLQLMEVNGEVARRSHPLEVQGALHATFAILRAQLLGQTTIFDVRTQGGEA
jgi:hypothetical protein